MSVTVKSIYANCVHRADGCKVWKGSLNSDGYPIVSDPERSAQGKYCMVMARRVVYQASKGPVPARHRLFMTCNNKECLEPKHMQALTSGEIQRRAAAAGSYHSIACQVARVANLRKRSKLDQAKVQAIKDMAATGLMHRVIADQFGVSSSAVDHVVSGRRWGPKLVKNASVFHQAA